MSSYSTSFIWHIILILFIVVQGFFCFQIPKSFCKNITFRFFTVTSMKMAVFWNVAPCALVDCGRRFREACSASIIYQATRCNVLEHSHLLTTNRFHGGRNKSARPGTVAKTGIIMYSCTFTKPIVQLLSLLNIMKSEWGKMISYLKTLSPYWVSRVERDEMPVNIDKV